MRERCQLHGLRHFGACASLSPHTLRQGASNEVLARYNLHVAVSTDYHRGHIGLLLLGDFLDLCTCMGYQLQAFPIMEELQGHLHTQSKYCGVFIVWLHILFQDCSGSGCSCHPRRAASCHHHLPGIGHKKDGKAQCYCEVWKQNCMLQPFSQLLVVKVDNRC